MNQKNTARFLAAVLILLTAGSVFGQNAKQNHLLSKEGQTHPNSAQKAASHDDLPNYELNYAWRNNAWDTSAQTTYTYAINGDLIEEQDDFYNSGQFEPSMKVSFGYATNGELAERTVMLRNGAIWENANQTIRSYS